MSCLLIVGGVVFAGTPEDDLKFAQALGARGLDTMAAKVLDAMVKSSDPAAKRAGQYGKALITKQEAQIAAARFLAALERGEKPPIPRDDVLKLYADAVPKIDDYVKSQGPGSEAAFLLADTLVEQAEFLVGSRYPESMAAERQALVDEHKKTADGLFKRAIALYRAVVKATKEAAGGKIEPDSEEDTRITNAEFKEALASYRLALIYPKGALFIGRAEDAEEVLDTFLNTHYETLAGAYAMIYLGLLNYERAIRLGDADAGEAALNYFEAVYADVKEDPQYPDTIKVLGEAFYQYARTGNALARADGELKRKDAARLGDVLRMGRLLGERMRYGSKSRFALLALLEVADAEAARGNFEGAVGKAGQVLAMARTEGLGSVTKAATGKLTDWVANVGGAGNLPPALLAQIGDSLASEGSAAKAITFYEKAISASKTAEDIEQVGYEARRKIAAAYRKDKRHIAAGQIAWKLVQDFLKSGEGTESGFYQTASEACWQAAQSWKTISEATKRPNDKSHYEEILKAFRDKFPDHPQNADAAFSEALDKYEKKEFAEAAELFLAIKQTSPSYWSAQLRVPVCYRRLATEADEENAAQWHQKCLESSEALYKLASAQTDVPRARGAARTAMLMKAGSHHSLQQWAEANATIDAFFTQFPGVYPKKGYEYTIKIDALLALGKIEEAEAALKQLKEKLKNSGYIRRLNYDVYKALRDKFKTLGGRERAALAARAARLWEQRVETTPEGKLEASDYWFLADVLREAQEWEGAGDAYEAAANLATKPGLKGAWQLLAAEMAFKNARSNKDKMRPSEYKATLDKTRELFTSVLIPDAKQREQLLKILAEGTKWPSKDQWKWIVAKPGPLLTAAEVYGESSPKGLDGRWIGVRLLDRLHVLTKPIGAPGTKEAEYVNTWWDGAQLKLELYLAIAESNSAEAWSKRAAQYGHTFSRKLIVQYPKMDSPERVTTINALSDQLGAMR
jgi:hypothetical protein